MEMIRRTAACICLLLLCSCATENSVRPQLPADVSMNKGAGRGSWLIVMLRLESGEKLPFVVDTGCPVTTFDKSSEPKLGKRLGTTTAWHFGIADKESVYPAPKLYLGKTLLMTDTNFILTGDLKQLSPTEGHPTMGVLGMDVLEHYCIQLDFKGGRLRFLDDERANKTNWGQPFPLTGIGDGCFIIGENLVGAKGPSSLIDTGFNGDGWLTPKLFQQWTNQAIPPTNCEARSPNGVFGGETYRELALDGLDKGLNDDDSHTKFNGIGLHVLSENLVTLDFPKRTMYLKRTSDGPLIGKDIEAAAKSEAESALQFLLRLKEKGQSPGWSKNDHGRTTAFHFYQYPHLDSVTWDIQKKGDSSIYHYTVTRTSENSPWKLQKASQTDGNGTLLKQYPVP
jgi:hypothetical protein